MKYSVYISSLTKGVNMHYKYDFEFNAVSSDSDEGVWYSCDLQTMGNTLEELLDNAVYFKIDQDGGEIGDYPADDKLAHDLITEEYHFATQDIDADDEMQQLHRILGVV